MSLELPRRSSCTTSFNVSVTPRDSPNHARVRVARTLRRAQNTCVASKVGTVCRADTQHGCDSPVFGKLSHKHLVEFGLEDPIVAKLALLVHLRRHGAGYEDREHKLSIDAQMISSTQRSLPLPETPSLRNEDQTWHANAHDRRRCAPINEQRKRQSLSSESSNTAAPPTLRPETTHATLVGDALACGSRM